ncbi:MAG: DUF1015 domain-containing protein [Pirellulales bacterium]|nr:DUF1015 domain-containing protein [Pirellulales bacterium]
MPDIQAFRGIRYDLGHVGNLSRVVAPPYDVIDNHLQNQLYELHEANVVRLILNREETGDDEQNNRYERARRLLRTWQREGILFTEADPAIYVYHQVFQIDQVEHVRRGFMCRVGLERFGEGNIYPHEETHPKAKVDRLKLWQACRANLSQIFGLYPDPENRSQELLEQVIVGTIPLEATDHLNVIHRIWPVTDVETITQVIATMGTKPIFIADGHHRYETACTYRDLLAAEHNGDLPAQHPANGVLMMCVSTSDPGMIVLPTHRLFRGLPPISSAELINKLGNCFDARVEGTGLADTARVWALLDRNQVQDRLAFYTAKDGKWVVANIAEPGIDKLAQVARDHSPQWQSLGVSILHRLVIDTLLDLNNLPTPKYVHTINEVVDGLKSGDIVGRDATGQTGGGSPFELAALVMPATLEDIRTTSANHERMPAKSTYFYPKLLSGLVINSLE